MSKNISDKPTKCPEPRLAPPDDPIFERPFGIFTLGPKRPKPSSPESTDGTKEGEKEDSPSD